MSASISRTRVLVRAKARARWVAKVDLPTPPLPLATAMAFFTCFIPVSITGSGPPGSFWKRLMDRFLRPYRRGRPGGSVGEIQIETDLLDRQRECLSNEAPHHRWIGRSKTPGS